jgi:hypothetical protein
LTLIDVDEGVSIRKELLSRNNKYSSDGNDWYIALSYPNFLRKNAQKYTQSQLVASFLYLAGRITDFSTETNQKLDELQKEAQKLGEALFKIDEAKNYGMGSAEKEKFEWLGGFSIRYDD